ncbi:MAG: hypothetical protein PHE49_03585 [bacterium]|nr:hypothetical protein [bacterium]
MNILPKLEEKHHIKVTPYNVDTDAGMDYLNTIEKDYNIYVKDWPGMIIHEKINNTLTKNIPLIGKDEIKSMNWDSLMANTPQDSTIKDTSSDNLPVYQKGKPNSSQDTNIKKTFQNKKSKAVDSVTTQKQVPESLTNTADTSVIKKTYLPIGKVTKSSNSIQKPAHKKFSIIERFKKFPAASIIIIAIVLFVICALIIVLK